jgi:class 3 adenylate cyclase
MLFAATYPKRTSALITLGAFAKRLRSDDYPWAPAADEREAEVLDVEARWGSLSRADAEYYAPSRADDEQFMSRLAGYLRRSASPGAAAALMRMNSQIDVRNVLPTIQVPTLCLHRSGDHDVNIEEGRYIASRIPGAQFVELPGSDHWIAAGDLEGLADEIEEFMTGVRPIPEPDRVLATVLFTDIVGSTQRAVELGDRRWRLLLESHHTAVRRELGRFRGREIDTAGDGFLATFDGPARAIRCGVAVRDSVQPLGLEVRAGLHTGECELLGEKVAGIAVHTGARIAALAEPSEVLVSATVRDLVSGSGIEFEDRGEHLLKGVGERRIFAVTDA